MATLLVIDDSDVHRAEIRTAVADTGLFDTIHEAADGFQGLKLLLGEPVDVVLCDLELPGLDGEKLLRVKGRSPGGANIPFLFLTASTDVGRKARLLDDGACDALAKPIHRAELVARLRLHLKVKRLQDELLEKNAKLARLSTFDALTGLRTRRYLTELLAIEFLRARRYKSPLTVLMADLDEFKAVNDAHGHLGGDAILRGVAESLNGVLRATDVPGRYGGEELIVVMPQIHAHGAKVFAERWRQLLERTTFQVPGGHQVNVTVSIGIADHRDHFEGPDEIVALADEALYLAKDKGRNRVEIA